MTQQQHRHFSERGWVVQEGVFDDSCMDACRMGMDELATTEPSNSQAVDMQTHSLSTIDRFSAIVSCTRLSLRTVGN